MPKVNGFQVCRSIRQHLQRSRIIIACPAAITVSIGQRDRGWRR